MHNDRLLWVCTDHAEAWSEIRHTRPVPKLSSHTWTEYQNSLLYTPGELILLGSVVLESGGLIKMFYLCLLANIMLIHLRRYHTSTPIWWDVK